MALRSIAGWSCLFLLAAHVAAQDVHVVGPAAGPGIDFTVVQEAVAAAADGDVLVILPGSYDETVLIQDRQLVLAGVTGPAGERATLLSLVVSDLAAERSVVVRGLRIAPLLVNDSLSILQCAGAVSVEDCVVVQSLPWVATPQRVEDSDRVVFTRCTLRGTAGQSGSGGEIDGSPALIATRSAVALYDCDVAGGDGSDAFLFAQILQATRGGPGVSMIDSTVFLGGCTVRGGQGGDGFSSILCLPAGDGGDGVVVDGLVRRLDTTISGGLPGAPKGCGPAPSAGDALVLQEGAVVELAQSLRRLVLSSPVEAGGVVSIDLSGAPSEPVILLQALAPLGQWKGGLKGTLAGAPPYLVFPLGPLGPDGKLHLDVPVPAGVLPAGLEAVLIADQLVSAAAGGGGVLSSPSTLVLVDDVP